MDPYRSGTSGHRAATTGGAHTLDEPIVGRIPRAATPCSMVCLALSARQTPTSGLVHAAHRQDDWLADEREGRVSLPLVATSSATPSARGVVLQVAGLRPWLEIDMDPRGVGLENHRVVAVQPKARSRPSSASRRATRPGRPRNWGRRGVEKAGATGVEPSFGTPSRSAPDAGLARRSRSRVGLTACSASGRLGRQCDAERGREQLREVLDDLGRGLDVAVDPVDQHLDHATDQRSRG